MAKKNRAGFLEKALQEFRWSFIITALVFIALGLLLILRPNLARELLAYAVGGALAVYGLFNILSFLPAFPSIFLISSSLLSLSLRRIRL